MNRISAKTQICLIVGDPVRHSLSPAMHNAAYEALGIDDRFVFTAAEVPIEQIKETIQAVRTLGIRGLTCTIPHKMAVMPYLDNIDAIAKKIGAVNTVVNNSGVLTGYNTDWFGTVTPLENILVQMNRGSLKNKKVALIGAGGAARAMAYGVLKKGASLSIYNRSRDAAEQLATETDSRAFSLDDLSTLTDADIILNATSLGMGEHSDKTPVPQQYISGKHIVFDAVYAPKETRFIQEARKQGAIIIHGIEMLLYQGTAQFELYTGHQPPVEVMRSVLNQ